MGIAITLEQYLGENGIAYDCVEHAATTTSLRSAESSHIPGEHLAKGVLLKRRDGYILAVVPASRQVELEAVGAWLRQPVGLATEDEVAQLFPDCTPGAVPPIAAAYGLRSLVDERLESQGDVYFEAGDHRTLVHVSGEAFQALMRKVPHGQISSEQRAGTSPHYFGA